MRAWLVACAALALAHAATRAAAAASPHHHAHLPEPDPATLDHIKSQILAKLGLSTRPRPLGAPPRDVVRQILARAADPRPPPAQHDEPSMREIIAIAHRGQWSEDPALYRVSHPPSAAIKSYLSPAYLADSGECCLLMTRREHYAPLSTIMTRGKCRICSTPDYV